MNPQDIIDALNRTAGLFCAEQVTTYSCVRQPPQGQDQRVTVEIHDRGAVDPGQRFYIVVRAENGRLETGTPADKVEASLATVRWERVD